MPTPPIGWVTGITEADSIMTVRLENSAWFASGMTNTRKTAALLTAQKRIVYCGQFILALTTPATTELKEAQCEMAYYLILHQAAEDRRLALQTQGVIEAGIVKEKYDPANRGTVAIPPSVLAILQPLSAYQGGLFISNIDRNENETINDRQPDGIIYIP